MITYIPKQKYTKGERYQIIKWHDTISYIQSDVPTHTVVILPLLQSNLLQSLFAKDYNMNMGRGSSWKSNPIGLSKEKNILVTIRTQWQYPPVLYFYNLTFSNFFHFLGLKIITKVQSIPISWAWLNQIKLTKQLFLVTTRNYWPWVLIFWDKEYKKSRPTTLYKFIVSLAISFPNPVAFKWGGEPVYKGTC